MRAKLRKESHYVLHLLETDCYPVAYVTIYKFHIASVMGVVICMQPDQKSCPRFAIWSVKGTNLFMQTEKPTCLVALGTLFTCVT